MITIIIGTNRKGSNSAKIAKHYLKTLQNHSTETVKLLDLSAIPMAWYENEGFSGATQHASFRAIQEEYMIPAEKFVFILPEYNGSIPGIVKLFIDNCSLYQMKDTFKIGTKKAILTGVSTGRAGNLRGLEHFTGMLNYLNITVYPDRLPISVVDKLLDAEGNLADESTIKVIENQVVNFLK